jgi:plasmid stabilization system protein ParE
VDIDAIAVFIAKNSLQAAEGQVALFIRAGECTSFFSKSRKKSAGASTGSATVFNNPQIRELIIGNYRLVYEIRSMERIDIFMVHHTSRLFNKI